MAIAPIERVVWRSFPKEFLEVVCIAFVVSERREERRLAKKISLYSKKYWPERTVVSVRHKVSGMEDEIRDAVFHQFSDYLLMHVVARAPVTIDHAPIR